jgi:hypothetical protein
MPSSRPVPLKDQLLAARAAAQQRAPEEQSRDWPDPDSIDWEEASTLLGIETYLNGAKYGIGLTADGKSVWARIAYAKWTQRSELAGMSAITFASDIDRALRKLAIITREPEHAGFKPDPFAK